MVGDWPCGDSSLDKMQGDLIHNRESPWPRLGPQISHCLPPMAPAHDVSEPLEVGGREVPVVTVTPLHVLIYAV